MVNYLDKGDIQIPQIGDKVTLTYTGYVTKLANGYVHITPEEKMAHQDSFAFYIGECRDARRRPVVEVVERRPIQAGDPDITDTRDHVLVDVIAIYEESAWVIRKGSVVGPYTIGIKGLKRG